MTIDHFGVLQRECARIGELAVTTPRDAPVAHLPGWTVHDVIAHLIGDYLWVLGTLATREPPRFGLVSVETRGSALTDEWEAVSARLKSRLDGIDPDAPWPNFAQGDNGRLGFHPRRQAHETTIHRWDIESASGEPGPIDPDVAVDGIDELFEVYKQRYAPHQLATSLVVARSGRSDAWRVSPAEQEGFVTVERCDVGTLDIAVDVEAQPADLLLLLWGRIDLTDAGITCHRDPTAVAAFLQGPVTA